MIYKRAKYEKVKYRNIPIFLTALSFMIFLTVSGGGTGLSHTLEQIDPSSPAYYFWLFFGTAAGAAVVIMPGISGAVILLLVGVYPIALESVSALYIPSLLPIAAGAITGCVIGIIVLKKMLRFHPQALYFAILGLITGSFFTIFPGFIWGAEGALCILLTVIFAVISYLFSKNS